MNQIPTIHKNDNKKSDQSNVQEIILKTKRSPKKLENKNIKDEIILNKIRPVENVKRLKLNLVIPVKKKNCRNDEKEGISFKKNESQSKDILNNESIKKGNVSKLTNFFESYAKNIDKFEKESSDKKNVSRNKQNNVILENDVCESNKFKEYENLLPNESKEGKSSFFEKYKFIEKDDNLKSSNDVISCDENKNVKLSPEKDDKFLQAPKTFSQKPFDSDKLFDCKANENNSFQLNSTLKNTVNSNEVKIVNDSISKNNLENIPDSFPCKNNIIPDAIAQKTLENVPEPLKENDIQCDSKKSDNSNKPHESQNKNSLSQNNLNTDPKKNDNLNQIKENTFEELSPSELRDFRNLTRKNTKINTGYESIILKYDNEVYFKGSEYKSNQKKQFDKDILPGKGKIKFIKWSNEVDKKMKESHQKKLKEIECENKNLEAQKNKLNFNLLFNNEEVNGNLKINEKISVVNGANRRIKRRARRSPKKKRKKIIYIKRCIDMDDLDEDDCELIKFKPKR